MLEARNVSCMLGSRRIIEDVSAEFRPGKLTIIIGPNGSGKTTLMRVLSGELAPIAGRILYDGHEVTRKELGTLAKKRAVLSLQSILSFPLTVDEVIRMGRYPHFRLRPSAHDEAVCRAAIGKLHIEHLQGRNYLALSGGEQHMVHFARVLAQIWDQQDGQHRFLLLDEPTAFLDINHQHQFLKTVKEMARDGAVVIAVLHDINLAAQYADCIIAMHNGRKVAEGTPEVVSTPDLFDRLYGMRGKVVRQEGVDFPIVLF